MSKGQAPLHVLLTIFIAAAVLGSSAATSISVSAPNLSLIWPSSQSPSVTLRASNTTKDKKSTDFFLSLTFAKLAEVSADGNDAPVYSISSNFTSRVLPLVISDGVKIQEIRFQKIFPNNATLNVEFWLLWLASGSSPTNVSYPGNVNITLVPSEPALVFLFNVTEWTFANKKNSLTLTLDLEMNVGPLSVATGTNGPFNLVSVPYLGDLYLEANLPSFVLEDRNETKLLSSFAVVHATQPIKGHMSVTVPAFDEWLSYTAFFVTTTIRSGLPAASLLAIVGVLVGVMLVFAIGIGLIIKYGGRKANPYREITGMNYGDDEGETADLLGPSDS